MLINVNDVTHNLWNNEGNKMALSQYNSHGPIPNTMGAPPQKVHSQIMEYQLEAYAHNCKQCVRCAPTASDAHPMRQMRTQCVRCAHNASDAHPVRKMRTQCIRCAPNASDAHPTKCTSI